MRTLQIAATSDLLLSRPRSAGQAQKPETRNCGSWDPLAPILMRSSRGSCVRRTSHHESPELDRRKTPDAGAAEFAERATASNFDPTAAWPSCSSRVHQSVGT